MKNHESPKGASLGDFWYNMVIVLSTLIGIVLAIFSVSEPIPQEKPFIALEAPVIWDIPPTEVAIEESEPIPPIVATTTKQQADPVLCSCVQYLRERWNVPIWGDADKLVGNVGRIEPGIVVIFQLRERHVGLITKKEGNIISGVESNRSKCRESTWSVDLGNPEQTKTIAGWIDPFLSLNASKRPF